MKYLFILGFALVGFTSLMSVVTPSQSIAAACSYPSVWWQPLQPVEGKDWEILPQAASCDKGDVILSKRTELGIFSNYGETSFTYRGLKYSSVEAFWQAMKYPENSQDPRLQDASVKWEYTRDQVRALVGDVAKKAGDKANDNMKKLGIKWVSFEGERFEYKGAGQERHLELIEGATRAKVEQNPAVRALLAKTGNLVLKPDHKDASQDLPSYRYYEILMKIR